MFRDCKSAVKLSKIGKTYIEAIRKYSKLDSLRAFNPTRPPEAPKSLPKMLQFKSFFNKKKF